MPGRFAGKVAVVTGGAKGMGGATSRAFAREGAAVVIADLDQESGVALQNEIERDGGRARFVRADVARSLQMESVASRAKTEFGGVDYLINNAGIQDYGTVVTTSEEAWNRVIAINLTGVFLASKACVPLMLERGGGAIVNVASVQALQCQRNVAAYAASKGGVLALTREMALDLAPHKIRVNCVCPGSIRTPMLEFAASFEENPEAAMAGWGARHPIGRVGRPEEVASLSLFLCSEEAAFITGAPYLIDGGLLAGLPI